MSLLKTFNENLEKFKPLLIAAITKLKSGDIKLDENRFAFLKNKKFQNIFISGILFIALAKIIATLIALFLPISDISVQKYQLNNLGEGLEFQTLLAQKEIKVETKAIEKVAQNALMKDFRLMGTFLDANNSRALIQDGAEFTTLRLEDERKGYILKEITVESAMFIKGPTRFWLFMDEKNAQSLMETWSKRDVEVVKEEYKKEEEYKKADDVKVVDGKVFIKKSALKSYKSAEKIFNEISIQPQIQNDEFKGFKVTKVKDGSIFTILGLQKGDMIIKANGEKFSGIKDGFKYFGELDSMNKLKLTIIRDNQEKEISYEIF